MAAYHLQSSEKEQRQIIDVKIHDGYTVEKTVEADTWKQAKELLIAEAE